ncbi:site-specific integrase [Telluria aromaticivorans]|uniref:Site-specific integrase n=1 Tax=Telluria aromaticivorans TaxID=2725995 RepID=A0A7Y2K3T9_9BURK|nr:site-specific integrase [Telluria aromaticivorans]NNG25525.1 site-specific integrase [Telluria aromaticivorans]
MTVPEKSSLTTSLHQDNASAQAQALFPLENLQHLDPESARRCQSVLGHGGTYGFWKAPEAIIAHINRSYRCIDLRRRIAASLPDKLPSSPALDALLDEGVLWLTRLALLMRMGPAGMGTRAKLKPLSASTIAVGLYSPLPMLVARGVMRRLECPGKSSTGFAAALTADEVREWWSDKLFGAELKRLTQLHELHLWPDVPAAREFKGKTTTVRGARPQKQPQRKSVPFPAIPDDYLAAMGPRVLWLIRDLGPNLVHLLDTLPTLLEPGKTQSGTSITACIVRYFGANVWRDRNGQVIIGPPFNQRHANKLGKRNRKYPTEPDRFPWPPRHWSRVQALAATLQSAHLWIVLLVMAARVGEVAALPRDCIEFAQDGQPYANGKTYKPSRALAGREREWPIPEILVDVFAQQVKLVNLSERLARIIEARGEMGDFIGDSTHLWASLGASPSSHATERLENFGESLQVLARRIDLTDKPGGKNLHPHRFRGTLARLAGLAIDGSQKVLMLLLGHEDITTTLGYMQADPAFAKEVDDVTRELRILRGEALIEDMRAAMLDVNHLPYGGHGGGGAPVLSDAVRAYEVELHRTGEDWGVDTARELSVLLTNNGESARLISAYVVCTKVAGEVGLCSKKKGAIVASNCQTECRNRIEDKTGRRDTERVIPILVQHAQQNVADNNWLPLQRDKKQLEQELKRYDDIGAQWRDRPEVRSILEAGT